jgi:hypothetical protein
VQVPKGLPLPPLPGQPARDPFSMDLSLFQPAHGSPGAPGETPERANEEPPIDRIAALVGQMRLQSTMTGSAQAQGSPSSGFLATVDGTVLRIGDRYRGFTVKRIGPRFVVLEFADRRFVLKMD